MIRHIFHKLIAVEANGRSPYGYIFDTEMNLILFLSNYR